MTSTKNQQFYDPPPTPSAKTNNRFIDSDSARIYGDRKPNSLKVFSLLFLFCFFHWECDKNNSTNFRC